MGNLLDNAAESTPQGGWISVTGYRERPDVVFGVPDTRIGVTPEMAPAVLRDRDGRRIVLIEDDENVRNALRRILELDGHRVEVACDGPEGVAVTLAVVPEVAFIDLGLPGFDGHEVARRIRAALGTVVCLVALTAHGREQDRRRSREAGLDAHLLKPVSSEDLTRVLRRADGGAG